MKNKKMMCVFALISAVLSAGLPVHGAEGTADALLNTLPENCVAVVRVNNLNDALTKLDTYLAGASPVPVSLAMLVNMQLTAITGDAMLTGIDKSGSFALFVMPAEEGQVKAGLLVPVTSFDEFVKNNQNITKSDDGTCLLSSPQSTMGAIALKPALGGKYALAVPEFETESLAVLQKAIEDKTAKRLASRLNPAQMKEALTSPAWGYVNLSQLYAQYGQEITEGLEEAMLAGAQGGMTDMMEVQAKLVSDMFAAFAQDADSMTISILPEAALLTVDTTLRAKDGSETAKCLTADSSASKGYQLGGFTDNSYAVSSLMKVNQPMFKKYNEMMIKIINASAQEGTTTEQSEKMTAVLNDMMAMIGNEIAFSFSYASGTPPFRFREVVELKEGASVKTLMTKGLDIANSLYKSMNMPFSLSYLPGTETYKGTAIDSMKLSFTEGAEQNEEFAEAVKTMYGGEGIQYYMAQKGKLLMMTMGPKGLEEIKSLIDQPASTAVTGDMKTALDLLGQSGYTDFAASMNIIRLMKGMGEMMQTLGGDAAMNPFKNIFSGMTIQSQSCLVMGGKIADSQFGMRTVLPKQHLIEVVTAAMQIQQQMMQQQMQQTPTQPQQEASATPFAAAAGAGAGAAASPEKSSSPTLKTWIGKKAPELKMVDLDGQIYRVSRLKGKKVVLDFWATWCPPCKESIPHLVDLRGKAAPETATIIGLTNEAQDKVSEFVKTAKINYPIVIYSEEVPAPYGDITGLPTLFLIDAEGTIADIIEGYDPETTVQKLEAFLK
jgi:thiol-disulfide isomerase/thioredoxin